MSIRFDNNDEIVEVSNADILPITDISDSGVDKKITMEQIAQFIIDNAETISGLMLSENNLTDTLKTNYDSAYTHSTTTGNPHSTTKANLNLENVDNTSDLNKPISNATSVELATKAVADNTYLKTEVDDRLTNIHDYATYALGCNEDLYTTSWGLDCLNNTHTGTHNCAIGYNCGVNITSGCGNFLAGTGAGQNLTIGSGNAFIGSDAGGNCTGVSASTYIGASTGRDSNGSVNVAVGNAAGVILTGSANVCIGSDAGKNSLGINNSVCIGQNAGTGYIAGQSCICIGQSSGQSMGNESYYCMHIGNNTVGTTSSVGNQIFYENTFGYGTIGNGTKTTTIGNANTCWTTYLNGVVRLGKFLGPTYIDSASVVEGGTYFNTTDKHFYGYNGTTWKQLDNA